MTQMTQMTQNRRWHLAVFVDLGRDGTGALDGADV